MQCEGGEIYYLVAGHLGLMSMPDPLLQALGMPDSSGETGSPASSIDEASKAQLERLADPMRMMKLFAVAHQTGSKDEVIKYMSGFESLLNDVAGSVGTLVAIDQELDAALDVAGHVLPIPALASGTAAAATVDVPESPSLPEPVAQSPSVPVPLPSSPEPSVPIPAVEADPVPPSSSVALPDVVQQVEPEPAVNIESEKQVARATQDAFSGAFSSELVSESEPAQASTPEPEVEDEPEFVSAAEHFIAADEDGSGALDVEELAQAMGTTIEEATELHAEADTDGDGVVSLSEFISSPAAEKTAALPKPVAPVRRPLGQRQPPAQEQPVPAQAPPVPAQQPPQPPPQQPWQQPPRQGWPQQPPQQQGWPQPQAPLVQPTIRSGVHCRNCGIGLDPYWRFCPVCGQQNLGY